MNKHIPTFFEFMNEAEVPKEIELNKLDKLDWNFESDITDKFLNKKEVEFAKIYKVKEKDRNLEYTFKAWFSEGLYHIVLIENGKIILSKKYLKEDKIYFDQDCQIIIGSKIKF